MIVLLLIVLGLVLGSFVNALVWRLRHHKDWVKERSECTHCHHMLGPLDLVPVFSWVFLKGRCHYCHKKIEDNPLVEITLPLLFVVSYLLWPVSVQGTAAILEFGFWLLFLVGFLALAVYDLKWFLLPNKLVFPLIALAVLQVLLLALVRQDGGPLLPAAAGAFIISGLFYILFQLSKGTWIGGGDVKLGIVLGLLAGGVMESLLLIFLASLVGVVLSLPKIIGGRLGAKSQLPFGPLLIIGLIIVKLYGFKIIEWYTGLFYV